MATAYNYITIDNGAIYNSDDFYINNLGDVVWSQLSNSGLKDLCLYHNGTINRIATINTLTNTAHFQINNIGQIVWSAYENENLCKIYFYNNGSIIPISDPNYSSDYPSINNKGQVVWVEYCDNNYRLCLYENETISRIITDNAQVSRPQVNDNGWITWETVICSGGQCVYKINLYNKIDIIQVATSLSDNLAYIQLNNKNQIAFREHSNSKYYIKLFEGSTTKTIYENAGEILWLRLNNNGAMVWTGLAYNDWDIFYYHDGIITPLYRPGFDDYDAQINNKDQVVWTNWPISSNIREIFYYKNGNVSKISNNNNRNEFAKINDVGQMVWLSGSNICLATPISHIDPINSLLLGD
jgi:hypothetical protein